MKSPVTAFSLVEVTLAIGLAGFCLLAILGLLPIGLKSVKNAREASAAANALNSLAEAIRDATNPSGVYAAGEDFPNITWVSGGEAGTFSGTLSLSGHETSGSSADARLAYRVELSPPSADRTTPGRARISISWPVGAEWIESSNAWSHSEGMVSAGIQFLPQ